MPLNNSSPNASSVFFSHLQLAHPSSNLRLYAECQVQLQTDDRSNSNIQEKLSLRAGVGSFGLESTAQDLCDVVESSLRYADLWGQLQLRPVLPSVSKPGGQPCFSIVFRIDSHLLSRYNTANSAISRIHLALLYTRTAHQPQNTMQVYPGEEVNEILDPGSPDAEHSQPSCIISAAIPLLDLALRTFILGKRPRGAIKGLMLESHHIQKSLADLDPLSFRLGYRSLLIDRSEYIGRIAETLCGFQRRASSDVLKAAFDRLAEGRDNELRSILEQKLFRLAEDVLRDGPSSGTKHLKPLVLRYPPQVPAPLDARRTAAAPIEPTSLFDPVSRVGSEAVLEMEIEQDKDGDGDDHGGWFASLFDQDDVTEPIFGTLFEDRASSPFENLFDDGDEHKDEARGEEAHHLLLDSDEVLLDDDWDEDAAAGLEWEWE